MKIHSSVWTSCEIEDSVETHLCKLCVILRYVKLNIKTTLLGRDHRGQGSRIRSRKKIDDPRAEIESYMGGYQKKATQYLAKVSYFFLIL